MSPDTTTTLDITPKLIEAKNWPQYYKSLKNVLQRQGIWSHVETKTMADLITKYEKELPTTTKDLLTYQNIKDRDAKATAIIHASVSLSILRELEQQTINTAYETFDYLQSEYKKAAKIFDLADLLFRFQRPLGIEEDPRHYVDCKIDIATQLSELGVKYDTKQIILQIISGIRKADNKEKLRRFLLEIQDDFHKGKVNIRKVKEEIVQTIIPGKKQDRAKEYANLTQEKNCTKCRNSKKWKFLSQTHDDDTEHCEYCLRPFHSKDQCYQLIEKRNKADGSDVLQVYQQSFLLDSGASSSFINNLTNTKHFTRENQMNVQMGNGSRVNTKGTATAIINVEACDKKNELLLENCHYSKEFATNLLSVGKLCVGNNVTCVFDKEKAYVTRQKLKLDDSLVIATGTQRGCIYPLDIESDDKIPHAEPEEVKYTGALSISVENDDNLHETFGHMGSDRIKRTINKEVKFNTPCPECQIGKGTKVSRPARPEKRKAKEPLEKVHSDIWGPSPITSVLGNKYIINAIDESTGYLREYYIPRKSEGTCHIMNEFVPLLENFTGKTLKFFQSDGGKEYVTDKKFTSYLARKGVIPHISNVNTPEENGIAERSWRTIGDMAHASLVRSGFPKSFLFLARKNAVKLRNNTANKDGKIPAEEIFTRTIPLDMFKPFGTIGWAVVPHSKRENKFSDKAIKIKYLYPADHNKGWEVYEVGTGRIIQSRDIKWDTTNLHKKESEKIFEGTEDSTDEDYESEESDSEHSDSETEEDQSSSGGVQFEIEDTKPLDTRPVIKPTLIPIIPQSTTANAGTIPSKQVTPMKRSLPSPTSDPEWRPTQRQKLNYVNDIVHAIVNEQYCFHLKENSRGEPRTIKEAMASKHWKEWKEAIKEEIRSLIRNKTWQVVDKPTNVKTIKSKLVFKLKLHPDGEVEKFKVRLCGRGDQQKEGIHYTDTFANAGNQTINRMLLAYCNHKGIPVWHFDFSTAFLNANMDTDNVYMELEPELVRIFGNELGVKEQQSLQLLRCIYGLKQSNRQWEITLKEALMSLGFRQSKIAPSLYIHDTKNILMPTCVDDLLVGASIEEKNWLLEELQKKFVVTDKGEVKQFNGMTINRNMEDGTLFISLPLMIKEALHKYGLEDANISPTPMVQLPKKKEDWNAEDEKNMSNWPYQSLIGLLLYIALCCRTDILLAVIKLAQLSHCYTEEHWIAAKRVLRYLKGTRDHGILFRKTAGHMNVGLLSYSDADWAGDDDGRKSMNGYVVQLCGQMISFGAMGQKSVALSSLESEWTGVKEAAKEVLFLRHLLEDIGEKQIGPTTIKVDNKACIEYSVDAKYRARTKHIGIHSFFVRDEVSKKNVKLEYIHTNDNLADILTKPLPRPKFVDLRERLGIVENKSSSRRCVENDR